MRTSLRLASRAIAGVLALGAVAMLLLGFGSGTKRAQVPHVLGKPKAAAIARIERHNLRARVIRTGRAARRLPPRYVGQVVHQNFRGGITLPEGSVVRLTVFPRDRTPAGRGQVHGGRGAGTHQRRNAREHRSAQS